MKKNPISWLCLVLIAGGCAATQPEVDPIPRAWDGNPNLNGVWQAMGTANWNLEDHGSYGGPTEYGVFTATPPGLGVVVEGEIPYQDWALEQRAQNFAARFAEDTEVKCFLPGIPRANYMPYPFHILQGDQKIMMVYGFAEANRTIHMDKETPEEAPIDSWMGRSHGRWEGDTLVVEAHGFNGQAWLDRAGNFASDTLKVEERFTPMGPDSIWYEARMEDPNVYTAPWTIALPLYRRLEPNAQVLEFKCVEYSEELLYGHLRRGAEQGGQ